MLGINNSVFRDKLKSLPVFFIDGLDNLKSAISCIFFTLSHVLASGFHTCDIICNSALRTVEGKISTKKNSFSFRFFFTGRILVFPSL